MRREGCLARLNFTEVDGGASVESIRERPTEVCVAGGAARAARADGRLCFNARADFRCGGADGPTFEGLFRRAPRSLGAAVSMGLSEALSDDGTVTGRGGAVRRGSITGV